MAFNFPASPVVGDLFTAGDYTYRWDGEKWTSVRPNTPSFGTTAQRPARVIIGQTFFDTTLGIPIWNNGLAWVNATGTPV